jgi:SAM-dependent methyltransferase
MNHPEGLNICPLCSGIGTDYFKSKFFTCERCTGIFLAPSFYLDASAEKARYDHHDSDVYNVRYRAFVKPVVDAVLQRHSSTCEGLDFGSGKGPVVSVMLQELGYGIVQYDPFYAPNPEVLNHRYDYIVCCEVMEHFHHPREEFERLFTMLKPGGSLICMTHIYTPDIDFKNWYYKNDKTHVFIYTPASIAYINEAFGFSEVEVEGRVIVLVK